MRNKNLPFNVELLMLTPARTQYMRPVTSIEFFEPTGGNLHDDGLFSVPIFGRVGSEERDLRFSYIDIKLEVLHPVIYERLLKLKSLYSGILSGTQHAKWDATKRDFVATDEVSGETGYSFFMKHWKQIDFVRNDSTVRDMRIQLIEKYRDRATTSKILVMPAGLRDIETDDNGRVTFSDVNEIYRKLLMISSTIPETDNKDIDPAHDLARTMLQNSFNELYKLIELMLTGKKGFFQSKWASRAVFNSTRNVITAADLSAEFLGGINAPRYTDTVIGLHQMSRALLPVTMYRLKTAFLDDVFSYGDNQARLVDPTTLESCLMEVAPSTRDRWTTSEGLEKVIASYGEVTLRDKPVMVEGCYLALVYLGPNMTFRVFYDINDLPEGLSREHVRPITLVELIYLSGYRIWGNYYGFVTRYPVTGVGSCFPATLKVKTTTVGEMRRELDENWQPMGDDYIATEYPVLPAQSYQDSHVVNSTRLKGLGGDFDGDMCSFTAIYSDEAVAEQRQYLGSKNAYADPRGGLRASSAVPTIELVSLNMLGRLK